MKKVFLSILAATALAACSKSETPVTTSYQASDIPINVVAGAVAGSRAPYADIPQGTQALLEARVIGSLSKTDFTSPAAIADGKISFQAQLYADYNIATAQAYKAGFSPAAYYPMNPATEVYLAGLYPADDYDAGNKWVVTGASAVRNIDGKSDIMSAPIATTTKTDATSNPTRFRNLGFNHELTLFNIKVVADPDNGTDASNYWGNVVSITLSKIGATAPLTKLTVNLAEGGNTTSLGSPAAALPAYVTGTDTPFTGQAVVLTTVETTVSYVIAPYFTLVNANDNANAITLDVTTSKSGGVKSIPVTINNTGGANTVTKGKSYDITLTFKATQIMATATVAPWEIGGEGSGSVE